MKRICIVLMILLLSCTNCFAQATAIYNAATNTVHISGRLQEAEQRLISAGIIGKNDEWPNTWSNLSQLKGLAQTKTDLNGVFNIDIPLSSDIDSGAYKVKIGLNGSGLPSFGLETGTEAAFDPNTVFLSPAGVESNNGTMNHPVKTIARAMEIARRLNNGTSDVSVVFRGGDYKVDDTILLSGMDGGKNGHKVSYEAYPGEVVTISGGQHITGWEISAAYPGLWEADCFLDEVGQLYINGKTAQRAQSEGRIGGLSFYDDVSDGLTDKDGIYIEGGLVGADWRNQEDIQLHRTYTWTSSYVNVTAIEDAPDGKTLIKMNQPFFHYATNGGATLPVPWITLNEYSDDMGIIAGSDEWYTFYVVNAFELLDSPGEWYFDKGIHKIYYMPRPDEQLNGLNAVVPVTEGLIRLEGSSPVGPVSNISFKGITFANSAWNWPLANGVLTVQGPGYYTADGYEDSGSAAVELRYTNNIEFKNCDFINSANGGLYLEEGCVDTLIDGTRFNQLGGYGVLVGRHGHATLEDAGDLCENNTVQNSCFTNIAETYWSNTALFAYYTAGLKVLHNDFYYTPYSAVSVGWGWDLDEIAASDNLRNNTISYNRIIRPMHKMRYDGAGIYTLGKQPGSLANGNFIEIDKPCFAAIYFDAGSSGYTAANNVIYAAGDAVTAENTHPYWAVMWTPETHDYRLYNNYSNINKNAVNKTFPTWSISEGAVQNGTNCSVEGTVFYTGSDFPPAARQIIENAGAGISAYTTGGKNNLFLLVRNLSVESRRPYAFTEYTASYNGNSLYSVDRIDVEVEYGDQWVRQYSKAAPAGHKIMVWNDMLPIIPVIDTTGGVK